MPFGLGRKKADVVDATPAPAPAPAAAVVVGTAPCSERGCARSDAAPCGYVDRRGRRCATAFCPDHQGVFDGRAFCRRHVGTLRAIGLDIVQRQLAPDLENRAPSLVNWICNDLDERVRRLLGERAFTAMGEELGEERVHLVRGNDGTRHWDRSWKLLDHTGVTLKVTVSVNESDDTRVIVRLGRAELASVVPPWIDRRLRRIDVDPVVDADERRIFYDWLFTVITKAVDADRDPNRRGI